ncbi:sulfotransferase [Coraliomargarita sp. W4R53]
MQLHQQIQKLIATGRLHRPALEISSRLQELQYVRHKKVKNSIQHKPIVCCVGNFKTGTVTIKRLLDQKLTGQHEPNAYLFTKKWRQFKLQKLSIKDWEDFLIQRTNSLHLDYESSGFLTTEAPTLARIYPNLKFILTIREPESWLRSIINHILNNRARLGYHYWEPILQIYFGKSEFSQEENLLKERSLYPLKAMLDYWKSSNQEVIDRVPASRLLIIETAKLSSSVERLEHFMGWEAGCLNRKTLQFHKSKAQSNLLDDIDRDYIESILKPYKASYSAHTQCVNSR